VNRICWRLVDFVSRALDPGERDAVNGDLAESGAFATAALRDVLGLVARRQAALWKHWRPWLTLAMAAPLGLALSVASRSIAHESGIYVWLYANNWTAGYLTNPGARRDLLHFSSHFLAEFLALAAASWLCGKLIAAMARRSRFANGAFFCLALLLSGFAAQPLHDTANAAVFSLTFYAVIFPIIVQTVFVICPSLLGLAYEIE
jgi:hypothetical protein